MFKQFLIDPLRISWRFPTFLKVSVTTAILVNIFVNPSFAGDPFRSRDPHKIGDNTEAVFKAIFQQGNYSVAKDALRKAVSSEPWILLFQQVWLLWAFSQILVYLAQAKQILSN